MKLVGTTNCTWPAYSAPDSPPIQAPITNAHSLNLNVGTPMISAASSSSRMATQARPTLERSRLPTNISTMMISTSDSQNHHTPLFRCLVNSPQVASPALPAEKIPSGCFGR